MCSHRVQGVCPLQNRYYARLYFQVFSYRSLHHFRHGHPFLHARRHLGPYLSGQNYQLGLQYPGCCASSEPSVVDDKAYDDVQSTLGCEANLVNDGKFDKARKQSIVSFTWHFEFALLWPRLDSRSGTSIQRIKRRLLAKLKPSKQTFNINISYQ